jgi:flagellar basal body-associated protein FliL
MSKNAQIAIVVIIVLLLAGAGYYWYMHTATQAQPVSAFVQSPATLPSGSSTSDASLQQDAAAIDAQLKGLSTDQASVKSSVSESTQAP